MSNLKMKYRLLLLIILPFLVLMGFLLKFILNEYEEIQAVKRSLTIFELADDFGRTIDALQQENIQSIKFLGEKDALPFKELIDARAETDKSLQSLKNLVLQNVDFSNQMEGSSAIGNVQNILEKLNSLNQKRESIDNRSLSIEDINHYFDITSNTILEKFSSLSVLLPNKIIFQNFISHVQLIQERLEAERIKRIVFMGAAKGRLSLNDYNELLISLGRQAEAREIFINLTNESNQGVYTDTVRGSALGETNRMIRSILAKGPTSSLEINPDHWMESQADVINLLKQVEGKLMDENEKWGRSYKDSLVKDIITTLAIILLTLLLTFYFTFVNLRSLTNRLQQEIDVLATSGSEILSAINHASSATAETAAAVTETTTTVEELKQTAQISADKARHVSDISNQTLNILKESEESISHTIDDMHRIQEGMNTISQNIIKLSEHSQAIGNIIDTVNDLAEQSHLLAVNAAIEAAKAGEQGRGFAIVAQEVRSLAEQSKQATIQVKSILHDIQNSTSAAVMSTEQGSKAVNQGMTQSTQTNSSIRILANEFENVAQAASQIAVSSQQQLVGVEQVNIAMANIKDASNLQVEHMKQIETGIQGLNDVGHSLKEMVKDYRL